MTEQGAEIGRNIRNILVAVDFSEVTGRVMRCAENLARAFEAQVEIIHVEPGEPDFIGYEPGPQTVRDNVAREYRENHRRLRDLAAALENEGLSAKPLLVKGIPAEKILEKAVASAADLIVMGSHGHGALYHLVLGSVSDGVIQKAHCPVLLVPSQGSRD